jgi:hypothetical protein
MILKMMMVIVLKAIIKMTVLECCRQRQQQPGQRQPLPGLGTKQGNMSQSAAACIKAMCAAVADARVHQQRIAGPAAAASGAAFDRFFQLIKKQSNFQ